MEVDRVDTETDDLDAPLVELRFDPRHITEFGGADRSEVLGVREQNAPGIAEPFMEPDVALCGVGLEIRGDIAELECHLTLRCLMTGEGPAPRPDRYTHLTIRML